MLRLVLIPLMATVLLLNSCALPYIMGGRAETLTRDDREKTERWNQIRNAIEQHDKDAIKSMFSEQALAETVDIDGGIDYIFDFIEGDILSWETAVAGGGSDNFESGHVKRGYTSWGYLNTDKERYLLFFLDNTEDTEHPENVGLYMLQVIKAEDEYTQFDGGWINRCAGIYRPELAEEQNNTLIAFRKLLKIIETKQDDNKEALKSMFSKKALSEANDIDSDINYYFQFTQGDIINRESVKGNVEVSGEPNHVVKMARYLFSAEIDRKRYLFFTVECLEDADNPENVGLYMLQVIKAEDEATQFDEGEEILCPGIYRPEKFTDIIRQKKATQAGSMN